MYKIICFFIIIFTILVFPLHAENSQSEYKLLADEYHHFFQKKRFRSEWLKLINKFQKHGQKHKNEDISAKSFYNVATLSYKLYQTSHRQSDLNKSIRYYKMICIEYTRSNLADDSCSFLYKIYHKKRKNHEQSKYYAKYILKHYKNSDSYNDTLLFIKKNYPIILDEQNKKTVINNTKEIKKNKFVTLKLSPEKIQLISNSSKNEGAKIGEIRVDGELTKIFIDFKDETFRKIEPIILDSFIKKIRFGQYQKNIARMVIELEQFTNYKILNQGKELSLLFFKNLNRKDINPKELIKPEKIQEKNQEKTKEKLDINIVEKLNIEEPIKIIKQNTEQNIIQDIENNTKTVNKTKQSKPVKKHSKIKTKYTIIVDAGHGGKDPGARSHNKKHKEKEITLQVALKLARKLKKNPKYKVILTRKTDKYLSLDERTDIANDNNGDIFISLHINAIRKRNFHGIETFYLNIAADNYSRRLENVENAENQKKITDLQFILADLLKKANTKESISLAKFVQQSLIHNLRRKYKNIRDLGVKNAMFYVLLDTKMPSILVELGFITNDFDLKRLLNNQYQEKLAESIVRGVDKFFRKYKKKK